MLGSYGYGHGDFVYGVSSQYVAERMSTRERVSLSAVDAEYCDSGELLINKALEGMTVYDPPSNMQAIFSHYRSFSTTLIWFTKGHSLLSSKIQ